MVHEFKFNIDGILCSSNKSIRDIDKAIIDLFASLLYNFQQDSAEIVKQNCFEYKFAKFLLCIQFHFIYINLMLYLYFMSQQIVVMSCHGTIY